MASGASLRRLLGTEVGRLVDDVTVALPGLWVAIVDRDGEVAHASGDWPAAALQDGRLSAPATATDADERIWRLPIMPRDEELGWLVARESAPGALAADGLLAGLQRTLNLLLRETLDKKDLARETLERYREINLLYRASATIGACLDADEVPRLVLSESERVVSAGVALVVVDDASGAQDLDHVVSRGRSEDIAALRVAAAPLIASVRATGRPDISAWTADAGALGSALCAPIVAGDRALGVIVLGRTTDAPVFNAGEEKLVAGLATQAGIALERTWLHERETRRQRLDEELAVARRIQLTLLPAHPPEFAGWSFAAAYQAARQVGGDFYDFLEDRSANRVGVVIADVTGKGVPAALMMAYSRAVLRAESMAGRGPSEVLERTNRLMRQDRQARLFVTAFYADIDLASGRLGYANAGHEAPLLVTQRGECREIDAPGVLLGAFGDVGLEAREATLEPGATIVFYTDGVTEARNPDAEMFGDERLREAAQAAAQANRDAQSVLDGIVGAVARFTAGAEQSDDLTMVVVRRDGDRGG